MLSVNPSDLQCRANDALQSSTYNPKKLVLLHTSVALGSSLLVAIVNLLLSRQIAGTGGLSGMGLRSVLSTIQSVLEFAVVIALPFWEIGLIFAALGWSRKEEVGPRTLLQGFQRFRSVLGLNLLRGLLFISIGFFVFYFSFTLFMLTPLSAPLWELLEPLSHSNVSPQEIEALLTPEMMTSMAKISAPMLGIFGVIYALVSIPLFFRLRFAEYVLADGAGAIKSLLLSLRLTKRKSVGLLKVDLHFWWYYLVLILLSVVNFGDVILKELGIALPLSADVGSVLFYVLAIGCQVGFCWQYQATVSTTYALTYQQFNDGLSANIPQPKPANVPWST